MPTVQSGGTVTRRTLAPCKRASQIDTLAADSYNELNNSNKYENTTRSYINNNNKSGNSNSSSNSNDNNNGNYNSNNNNNSNNSNNNNNSNNRSIKQNPSPTKTNSNSNSISVGGVSGLRVLRGQKTSYK